MYGRRRLTRVEMAVYAFIVAVVIAVFSTYVLGFMEAAEKAAMETTVTNVTAAINIRYAMLMMAGHPGDAAQWTRANPFDLAHTFPPNYRGALGSPETAQLDRPAWVFDTARLELVYLPRLYSHLEEGEVDEVRFRLERDPSGFGFRLAPTSPYKWGMADFAKLSQIPFRKSCTSLFS